MEEMENILCNRLKLHGNERMTGIFQTYRVMNVIN